MKLLAYPCLVACKQPQQTLCSALQNYFHSMKERQISIRNMIQDA